MPKHIMVDLETWGTTPGCDIRSIGAVEFDPVTGALGEEFYVNVIGGDRYGLTKDPATEKWWSEQSEEAQSRLRINQKLLPDGLRQFCQWWNRHAGGQDEYVRFWAHGPHFDEQILAAVFRAVDNCSIPWTYRAPRDLRTILEAAGLDPKTGIPVFGLEHDALDDAKAQALGVIEAFRRLALRHVSEEAREIVRETFGAYAAEIAELRDRRDGLLLANNREVERRRAAEALLREAAGLFRFYEKSHRAKIKEHYGDAAQTRINMDARPKAERNAAIAERIEAFLNGENNA